MVDVLCVYVGEEKETFDLMPPLGLAWIAAVLRQSGFSVEIIDLSVERRNIKDSIERLNPKILCISDTSTTRFRSFSIVKTAKEINPDILTVYGGPHATFTAEDTLSHIPWIDVIVRGEGEYTTREIASTLKKKRSLRNILGISYRTEKGSIRHNLSRPRIKNLDELPFPARDLLPIKKYRQNLKEKKSIPPSFKLGEEERLTIKPLDAGFLPWMKNFNKLLGKLISKIDEAE